VRVRFLKTARTELEHAVRYYKSQAPDLGGVFLLELVAALDRVSRFPAAWQSVDAEIRRCLIGKFPYGLIYVVERQEILVLGVAHLNRRPENWRTRLGNSKR